MIRVLPSSSVLAGLLALLPASVHAEEGERQASFGFTVNASLNSELQPIRIVPSVTYFTGKSQFELGFGVHPFVRTNQRTLSVELNHKYFANGVDRILNLYLISQLAYGNQKLESFFPTTNHYVFVNAGYGLELNGKGGSYMGTNVTFGLYGLGRQSENPYEGFASRGLLEEAGFNVAFQLHAGYRF